MAADTEISQTAGGGTSSAQAPKGRLPASLAGACWKPAPSWAREVRAP